MVLNPRWFLEVEIGRLLQAVCGVQQLGFLEVVADQLQAHGHAL